MTELKQERYDWKKHTNPERGSKISNTVPDNNYTIRDILERFTTGQPINGMMSYNEYDGEYDNSGNEKPDFDGFMPNPRILDLVDRAHLSKQAQAELKEIETRRAALEKSELDLKKRDEEKIKELTNKIQILENPAGGKNKTE